MSSVNECLINLFVERFEREYGAKPTKDIQQGLRRRLLGGWLGDMQCNAVTNEMECVILPHPITRHHHRRQFASMRSNLGCPMRKKPVV